MRQTKIARFDSRCPMCHLPIRAGKTTLALDALNRWVHASHNPIRILAEYRRK